MLVMTCNLGGVIRIGEAIQVAVRGRYQDRVAISVIAPATSGLEFDGVVLNPLPIADDRASYYFSLRNVRRFCVDDVQVMVWLPGDAVPLAADCLDCVHIGIVAPSGMRISYEHVGRAPDVPRLDARSVRN